MNTPRTLLLVWFVASSLFASLARADEASYAKILKERDAVLSQIVAQRESLFAIGTTDGEALQAARLALWSFRRDTATTKEGKIAHQESIVGLYEKNLADLKARARTGVVGSDAVLLATDSLLQAQQTLEELRTDRKTG